MHHEPPANRRGLSRRRKERGMSDWNECSMCGSAYDTSSAASNCCTTAAGGGDD